MLAAGFVIDHRSWAPGRKTDIDPATLAADRAWTPAAAAPTDEEKLMAAADDIITAINNLGVLLLRGDPTTDPAKDTHNDNLGQIRTEQTQGFNAVRQGLTDVKAAVISLQTTVAGYQAVLEQIRDRLPAPGTTP